MRCRQHGFGMLRPNIELCINSGLDAHRNFEDNEANLNKPTESKPLVITHSRVPGLEDFGIPLKVIYEPDALIIQMDIHIKDIGSLSTKDMEVIKESGSQIALSDVDGEKFDIYEQTVIDTVATELGKYYDGDNDTAMKDRDKATLVYPSDYAIEEATDQRVFSFCCRLDPEKFWELD